MNLGPKDTERNRLPCTILIASWSMVEPGVLRKVGNRENLRKEGVSLFRRDWLLPTLSCSSSRFRGVIDVFVSTTVYVPPQVGSGLNGTTHVRFNGLKSKSLFVYLKITCSVSNSTKQYVIFDWLCGRYTICPLNSF